LIRHEEQKIGWSSASEPFERYDWLCFLENRTSRLKTIVKFKQHIYLHKCVPVQALDMEEELVALGKFHGQQKVAPQ
jgi:hypothetical protein